MRLTELGENVLTVARSHVELLGPSETAEAQGAFSNPKLMSNEGVKA